MRDIGKSKNASPKIQNKYYRQNPILVCRECGVIWNFNEESSMACPECFSSRVREAEAQEEIDYRNDKNMEGFN